MMTLFTGTQIDATPTRKTYLCAVKRTFATSHGLMETQIKLDHLTPHADLSLMNSSGTTLISIPRENAEIRKQDSADTAARKVKPAAPPGGPRTTSDRSQPLTCADAHPLE